MPLETIVQIGPFPPDLQAIIDAEFTCVTAAQALADPALRESVRAILTRGNADVPADLLPQLPKLEIIASSGVGYDRIPLEAARAQRVVVANTPGVLDDAVCELAVGMLLALLRELPAADRYVRDGGWQQAPFRMAAGLAGKRVGLVGLGRIGNGIAQRLQPFKVSLAYTGPTPKDLPHLYVASVTELARQSDILIVCCRGGESTRRLVNAEVLAALGPDGYLVNVARGSVVDEAALVAALQTGAIRAAALDVFDEEPLADSPLAGLPNTLLTPHIGSATVETRRAMLRLALDNLHAVLRGGPAITPV